MRNKYQYISKEKSIESANILFDSTILNPKIIFLNKIYLNINIILYILFLSIPPLPYFYQFLHLLIFINSSSSLFLSIPPPPYFYQFLLLLVFINSFSTANLLIPPPPPPPPYYEKQISIYFERKIDRKCKYSLRFNDLKSKNYILKQNIFKY